MLRHAVFLELSLSSEFQEPHYFILYLEFTNDDGRQEPSKNVCKIVILLCGYAILMRSYISHDLNMKLPSPFNNIIQWHIRLVYLSFFCSSILISFLSFQFCIFKTSVQLTSNTLIVFERTSWLVDTDFWFAVNWNCWQCFDINSTSAIEFHYQ